MLLPLSAAALILLARIELGAISDRIKASARRQRPHLRYLHRGGCADACSRMLLSHLRLGAARPPRQHLLLYLHRRVVFTNGGRESHQLGEVLECD